MDTEFKPDQIVCISHPDSISRLEQMHQRFLSQGMNVTLSPGVDPASGEERYVGCLRAHQNAVKRAKALNLPCLVVFEDDVVFVRTWSWIKNQLNQVPADYDIVRLCLITDGTYYREHVAGNVFRCWRAYGTQCYVLNAKSYDKIINFPASDPYDDQLSQSGLIEYALHPLPLYHEIGTSVLGNAWQQNRDDFEGPELTREQAVGIIDKILNTFNAPYKTQLRIIQALTNLKNQSNIQEIRFLRHVLEKVEVKRQEAIDLTRALITLSTELKNPTQN